MRIKPPKSPYYCIACQTETIHQVMGSAGDRLLVLRCGNCGRIGQHAKPRAEVEAAVRGLEIRKKIHTLVEHIRNGNKGTSRLRKKLYTELVLSSSEPELATKRYSQESLLGVPLLVDHQLFGRGVVLEVRDKDRKAVILFQDGERLLRCGGELPDDQL